MANVTKSSVVIAEHWNEALEGAWKDKNAFIDSPMAAAGVVVVRPDMPAGESRVGETINVPYFDSIGEFEDVAADGDALTAKTFGQSKEQATIAAAGLMFNTTRWAEMASVGKDIYEEGKRQTLRSVRRKMDSAAIAAAVASGTGQLVVDKYSATVPRVLDWDLLCDGTELWGDDSEDIAGLVVHSRTMGDLRRAKDTAGRPLWVDAVSGSLPRLAGIPVIQSDRMLFDGSAMSAVTPAGTTPPVITLTGTPNRPIDLRVECTVLGALGTSRVKWSIDGGNTFSVATLTAATILITDPLNENETTGVTLNIAAGNAAVNNVWTAKSIGKYTSLICKKGAIAFWFNGAELTLKEDVDISRNADLAAMWLYYAALRYKRAPGSKKTGIIKLRHNAGVL